MQTKPDTENPQPTQSKLRYFLLAGVIVLLIAGGLYFTSPKGPGLTSPRAVSEPALGPASASVTIIEYGDFGCTTCRGWEKAGVRDQILAKYGNQVRFVWRDFPVITAASPKAAEAGQCANDQGQFWSYHDILYSKAPALSPSDLKAYAAQLGLNTTQFDNCLDSGQHKADVDQALKDGYSHGFTATPSFLINGKALIGPLPLAEFSKFIDPFLQSKN